MKKFMSLLVIICIIVSLFSGCFSPKVSLEEDIIYQLNAGYLYTTQYKTTNRDEKNYNNEREDAIKTFMDTIEKTSKYSFDVIDGLIKYENNLLKYIDKIEDKDSSTTLLLQSITNKLFAYKIILDSKENEIAKYMDMRSKNDETKAILNSYILYSLCDLIKVQNEYIIWLINNTATTSILLEPTSERQSDRLISSSESIYDKNIKSEINKMMFEYDKAINMNSYILSADYYASEYYLSEALKNIENIKSGNIDRKITPEQLKEMQNELVDIELLYYEIVKNNSRPSFLQPVPEKQSSFSFIKSVSAEDSDLSLLDASMPTIEEVSKINDSNYDKSKNYGTHDIAQNLLVAKTSLELSPNKMIEFVNNKSTTNLTPAAKAISEPVKLTINNSYLTQIGIYLVQQNIKRDEGGVNAQYAQIIKHLTDKLTSVSENITDEQKDNIKHLLENELSELLEGRKDEFVDRVINSSAEELIDTYNVWIENSDKSRDLNFDKDDLINLLIVLGIDIEQFDFSSSVPSPQPSPSNSQVIVSPTPSPTSTPSNQPEDPEVFDVSHIVASYDLIKRISVDESNERILELVYGWVDPLNYSNYRKDESKDSSSNLNGITFYDDDNIKIGWQTKVYSNSIEYTYHFPNNNDLEMTIIRNGTYDNSYFYQVQTEDISINRETAIRFYFPDDSTIKPYLVYIIEKQENMRDGLNMTIYNDTQTFTIYSMEKRLASYTLKNDIIIEEIHNQYVGENIFSDILKYYDNGDIRFTYSEINGDKDGVSYIYYENGKISFKQEYSEGKYHGTVEEYYENGTLDTLTTYVNGIKNGETLGKYENGNDWFIGEYTNGETSGIWYTYEEDGTPTSEIGYKNGMYDGIYHTYATGSLPYNSIHVIGYYKDGKKDGIWEYGYNNVGYTEKYLYENDIKIWMEVGNTRTYYNSDGSIKSTEKIN